MTTTTIPDPLFAKFVRQVGAEFLEDYEYAVRRQQRYDFQGAIERQGVKKAAQMMRDDIGGNTNDVDK